MEREEESKRFKTEETATDDGNDVLKIYNDHNILPRILDYLTRKELLTLIRPLSRFLCRIANIKYNASGHREYIKEMDSVIPMDELWIDNTVCSGFWDMKKKLNDEFGVYINSRHRNWMEAWPFTYVQYTAIRALLNGSENKQMSDGKDYTDPEKTYAMWLPKSGYTYLKALYNVLVSVKDMTKEDADALGRKGYARKILWEMFFHGHYGFASSYGKAPPNVVDVRRFERVMKHITRAKFLDNKKKLGLEYTHDGVTYKTTDDRTIDEKDDRDYPITIYKRYRINYCRDSL